MNHSVDNTHRRPSVPPRATVAIVGAGLGGLAIADAVASPDAVLLDAGSVGAKRGESLGVVRVGPSMHVSRLAAGHGTDLAAACVRAGLRNAERLGNIASGAPEVRLQRCGSVRLAADAAEAAELERSAEFLTALERPVRLELASQILPDAPARFRRAAVHVDDAVVDAANLLRVLERRVRDRGIRCVEGARVTHIEDAGEIRLSTTRGTLRAEVVVVATEATLPQLVAFCRFKIVPMRAQALAATAAEPVSVDRAPRAWIASHGYEMWRLCDDGSVRVSGSRKLPVKHELGTRSGTSAAVQSLLEDNLREFGRFEAHRVTRRWSGIQAVPCDGLPIVGAVPGRPRLFVCGGFGMNGLGWAFVAAEVIRDLLASGRAQHAAPFTPRRFV